MWRKGILLPFLVIVSLLSPRADAAPCLPYPDGLIGWWTGDADASDLVSTNSGTLEGGAAILPGYVGNAFSFDGSNSFVQIPDSPAFQLPNLTVEAWVRFDGLDSSGSGGAPIGEQYLVFKQNVRTNFFEGFFLGKIRLTGRDTFAFGVSPAAGAPLEVDALTSIVTNQWYHVAGVRGPDYIQIYVNGVLNSQTNASFPQSYGTNALFFGSSGQPYWDRKLRGSLDEVSIYNRALGSNEVAAIYAAGRAGKCKTPTIIAFDLSPGLQQVAPFYPMLQIGGVAGQPCAIQTSLSMQNTNDWIGLTNIVLGASSTFWFSPDPATNAAQFFRVTAGTAN